MVLEATINPSTRDVKFDVEPLSGRTDVDVTGIRFRCPNDIGIETNLYEMAIKIRCANARKELFTYFITDKSLDGNDVIFTWTLKEPASRYDGTLFFNVTAEEYANNEIAKRWNTRMQAVEVFKTLNEGIVSVTPQQLSELEVLLSQLNNTVQDYSNAVLNISDTVNTALSAAQAVEMSAAQVSNIHTSGDGTVILSGLSDPINTSEWYANYVEGAKWLKGRIPVASGVDLNSLTTIGNYYVSSGTLAGSLHNSPITDDAFSLTVERVLADGTMLRQTAIATSTNTFFVRNSTNSGSTWTSWMEFVTREEIIERDPENATTFTFAAKRGTDGLGAPAHNHFLLIGGGSSGNQCIWLGFIEATSTTVTIKEVTSIAHYALTATYNESQLTVTSDLIIYGGLRLIWLA